MNLSVRKPLAGLLILFLWAPQLIQAQSLSHILETDVTTDTGTHIRDEQDVLSENPNAPDTNLDDLAPTFSNTTCVGGDASRDCKGGYYEIITTTPAIVLDGSKPEGIWSFGVSRYGEANTATIRHDITPPKCAPAPTPAEYEAGTDYYSQNGLKNPWPQGLNGYWTTKVIEFYDNDPLLCRDQIGNSNQDVCKAAGGEVVTTGGIKICRFDQGSCPTNWNQHKNWSTTQNVTIEVTPWTSSNGTCTTTGSGSTNSICGRSGDAETSSHSWADKPVESGSLTQQYEGGGNSSTCGEGVWTTTCNAAVTHIGCLPDGVKDLDDLNSDGAPFVERDPKVDAANCVDGDGNSQFYYHEDQADCELVKDGKAPEFTQFPEQMSGCFSGAGTQYVVDIHNGIKSFSMKDNVANLTPQYCETPTAKIDCAAPKTSNIKIEHAGLGLGEEELGDQANAKSYRADDGPLYLHLELFDPEPDTACGQSGLNWEALVDNSAIHDLEYAIAQKEAEMDKSQQNLNVLKADTITARGNILSDLSAQLNQLTLNNIWAKVTGDLNQDTTTTYRQNLEAVVSGANALDSSNFPAKTLEGLVSLLELPKFETVPNISQYIDQLKNLNPDRPNELVNTYQSTLAQTLGLAAINPRGSHQAIESTKSEFLSYYNQWQIDKTENYSNVIPNWLTNISAVDTVVEDNYADFQALDLNYQNDSLETLSQWVGPFAGGETLQDLLVDVTNSAANHNNDQEQVGTTFSASQSTLESVESYLQNFNANLDTFDANRVDQAENAWLNANDIVSSINVDLDQSAGTFGIPLKKQYSTMEGGEAKTLISDLENDIRTLGSRIIDNEKVVTSLEEQTTTLESNLATLNDELLDLRTQLATLVTTMTTQSAPDDFKSSKITHLEISRLTGDTKTEQFFPPSTTPENGTTFTWDLNLYKFSDENQPIFTTAGLYELTLRAYDQAGNSLVRTGYIEIKPAALEVDASTDCNSAVDAHFANMQDTCEITFPQLDHFGNKIFADENLNLTIRDQDTKGSYNLVTQLGKNYQNGLRFVGGSFSGNKHKLSWKPNNNQQKVVELQSLLPTITVLHHEDNPEVVVGFAAETGLELPLVLEYPVIDARGNPEGTTLVDNVDLKVNFKPWINVGLSDRSGEPSITTWNIPMGTEFPIYVQGFTGDPSQNLPPTFNINVLEYFNNDGYTTENESLATPGKTLNFNNVKDYYAETGQTGMPDILYTSIVTTSALSGQQSLEPLFLPTGSYPVDDLDGSTHTIITPGIPLGVFTPAQNMPDNPPDIYISDAIAEEGQSLRFTLSLSNPAEIDTTVYVRTTDTTATVSEDYNYNDSVGIVIPHGASSAEYTIPTVDDRVIEEDESFALVINSYDSGTLADISDTGLATIKDNDNRLIITDVPAEEGEPCLIPAILHRPAEEDVKVEITPGNVGDTAQAGSDYENKTVSGTIKAGRSSILLPIKTIEDEIQEGLESFTVNVTSVTGGDLTSYETQASCQVHDDDTQSNISILSNSTVYEGDSTQITIALDQAENKDVRLRLETFDFADTGDGTKATADTDYTPRDFEVTIPAGTLTVSAPASGIQTKDDTTVEDNETFGVRIVEVLEGVVGDTSTVGVVTIMDDTPLVPPSIQAISPAFTAESTPEKQMSFTLVLDRPNLTNSNEDLVMVFELEDISATGGSDYDNRDLTVTIPAGKESGIIGPITIYDDDKVESAETFRIKHKSTTSGTLTNASIEGIGTIIDNDLAAPSLYIDDSSALEEDGFMNFTVRLSAPHFDKNNTPLVVNYRPTPISATAGSDYQAREYRATFNVGESQTSLEPVVLVDDADPENAELFSMAFSGVSSGHNLNDTSDTATGTILDGDNTNPPAVIISDASGTEGNRAEFTVALDSPAHNGVSVTLEAIDIGAQSPADYQCPSEELTVIFDVGEMGPFSLNCDLKKDDINEPLEDFSIKVDTVTGNVRSGGTADTATGTITNWQTIDAVIETPGLVMENDDRGLVEFTVNLYDNGQPLTTALETSSTLTFEPQDLAAIGGTSFSSSGVDFRSGPITTTLKAGKGEGSTTTKLQVEINNDNVVEINSAITTTPENRQEDFLMTPTLLSDNIRNTVDATALIQDDDSFSCDDSVKAYVIDGAAVEGDEVYFDVSLSGSLCEEDVELTFRTRDVSATAGDDYTGGDYTVTIPKLSKVPENAEQLLIPTKSDTKTEGNEVFQLEFVKATPASAITQVERKVYREDGSLQDFGTVPIEGTIIDDDPAVDPPASPDLIIDDASSIEGQDLEFVVRLTDPNSTSSTNINFQTSTAGFASPAVSGTDFDPTVATISIAAGQGAGIAIVKTQNDNTVEVDENLLLSYQALTAGTLNDTSDTGTGTIVDDDQTDAKPVVLINDSSALEGDDMTFIIRLEDPNTGAPIMAPDAGIQFDISVASGSATKNVDFEGGRTVTIPPNESQRDFEVTTIDDTEEESDETFSVRIDSTNQPSAITNINDTALGTILDNDGTCDPSDFCCMFPSSCLPVGGQPGADIEGQIVVDQALCSGDACNSTDTEAVVIGTTKIAVDIREEITRNAYSLIRGREAANLASTSPKNNLDQDIVKRNDYINDDGSTTKRWDVYVNDLPKGGVTYLDGQNNAYFRFGLRRSDNNVGTLDNPAVMSGNHTFVVLNGSVNIIGDMAYAGPEDSLGLIVLNSDVTNLQKLTRRGQLTIFKDVRHVIGAMFTDGSLVSNASKENGAGANRIDVGLDSDPNNDWDTVNGNDSNGNQLGRQLILTGNLLSKNTLGAADLVPPLSPWGDELSGEEGVLTAQMYDLNYIRRYVPEYDPVTLQHTNKNLCANIPGESGCYDNEKSFIIRIDPRLQEHTPPGFTDHSMTLYR